MKNFQVDLIDYTGKARSITLKARCAGSVRAQMAHDRATVVSIRRFA